MLRKSASLISAAAAGVLAACVATAPPGEGSLAPSGEPRDPSQILEVGDKAPAFEVQDEFGRTVRLADYRGKNNVVLIFYPVNNTPGCTRQLCAARDDFERYQKIDAVVFGVNPADAEAHRKFSSQHEFPFPLLADTAGNLVRDYGCRGTGGMPIRTVYAIDKSGTIVFAERGMPTTDQILSSLGG
ncbi:MAG: peroxiredoxin [Candidatus Sumerlaeia bacterium]|nr:peroxiredoxin [Candidatus Sumerlaeia bacterium]